jgi:hypothetical protein
VPEDKEIARFVETHFWRIVILNLLQHVKGGRSIDTLYVIRRVTNGTFMIGDSPFSVDENGDVTLLGVTYEGTEGLWELLIKTNVDRSLVTPHAMRSYKRILESTNGQLKDNDYSEHIKTARGPRYIDVVSKLFPMEKRRWRIRQKQQQQRWTTFSH